MRRIVMLVTVVLVMAAMMAASAPVALAEGEALGCRPSTHYITGETTWVGC